MTPTRLSLDRHPPGFTCTIGSLTLDGNPFCATLEGDHLIAPGQYEVILTESPEAVRGVLWTPSPKFLLPELLNVPSRTGIRIHAGNTEHDTKGCIVVGYWRGGEFLNNSRNTLASLMDMLEISQIAKRPIVIEVNDPLKESA